jgi:nucleolar protein 53
LFSLAQINKEFKIKLQTDSELLKNKQDSDKLIESVTTSRLSRYIFQNAPMSIKLPDEICDNLRQLKPEGNLFLERFKSLQQRELIEIRVPVKNNRKFQMKQIESHDYKRFE